MHWYPEAWRPAMYFSFRCVTRRTSSWSIRPCRRSPAARLPDNRLMTPTTGVSGAHRGIGYERSVEAILTGLRHSGPQRHSAAEHMRIHYSLLYPFLQPALPRPRVGSGSSMISPSSLRVRSPRWVSSSWSGLSWRPSPQNCMDTGKSSSKSNSDVYHVRNGLPA